MARGLISSMRAARQMLSDPGAWLYFFEIPKADGVSFYRLVDNPRHIEADGKVWQAATVIFGAPDESGEGDADDGTLTVSNVSRIPMRAIEVDGEVLGQTIRVWLAHESTFTGEFPEAMWELKAKMVTANERTLTVTCGDPAAKRIPSRRYSRASFPQLLPQAGGGGGGGNG